MPLKFEKMPEVISAIIGEPVRNLLDLTSGIRISNTLSKIDPKFFDFFRSGGTYCFGLRNSSTGLEIKKKIFKIWKKLMRSMRDFCFEAQQNSSRHFENSCDRELLSEKVSQFACIFGEFKDENIEKIIHNDESEMNYFCIIFTLFLKTIFPRDWKKFEVNMNADLIRVFNDYLYNFQKSSTFSQITQNSKQRVSHTFRGSHENETQTFGSSQQSSDNRLSDYKLLQILDEKEESLNKVLVELSDKKREIADLKSKNKQLSYSIKYKDQIADERNKQMRFLEQRLSIFQKKIDSKIDNEVDVQNLRMSYDRIYEERQVLTNENNELRKQIQHLKAVNFDMEQELKNARSLVNLQIKSSDCFLGSDEKRKKDLEDQCQVKDIRIDNLQVRIKELRDQLVVANNNTEKLQSFIRKKEKKIIEGEREIAGLEDKIKHIERENSRLRDDLDSFRTENLKVIQSNAKHRAEKRSNLDSATNLRINQMMPKNLERLNMNKTLEEVALIYTEELSCLYSLMHDVFVNELTGEGLQDLVEKKLWQKDRDRIRALGKVAN